MGSKANPSYPLLTASTNGQTSSYTWDANGNLQSVKNPDGSTARSFSFDGANRLIGLAVAGGASYSYAYNGDGERVSQTANGTTTSYTLDLNSDLPQVLSDGANIYIPGIGQANLDGSAPEFYLTDANGSTRLVTDASGAVVGDPQNYDPFGNTSDTPSSLIGYTGEWKDASGLEYLRARYYDPSTGTFISKDPLSGSINDPASMNGYNYADDNPIMGSDPSGRCDWFRSFTDPNYSYSEARADCARDEYLANFAQQNGYGLGISTLIRLGNIAALNDELSAINSGKEFIADLFSNCSEVSGPAWAQAGWITFSQIIPFILSMGATAGETLPEPDFSSAEGEPFNQFANFTEEDWASLTAQEEQALSDPASLASKWQKSHGLLSDNWENKPIQEGEYLWGGEPGQSAFYTSDETIKSAGNDATKIFEGLQVGKPENIVTYRAGMTLYLVTTDTTAATSVALANTANGGGGFLQYFIPNYNEVLQPVWTLLLKNR